MLQVRLVDEQLTGDPNTSQRCEVLKDGEVVGLLPIREGRLLVRPLHFPVLSLDIDSSAVVESIRLRS